MSRDEEPGSPRSSTPGELRTLPLSIGVGSGRRGTGLRERSDLRPDALLFMEEGMDRFLAGDPAGAIRCWERVLGVEPDSFEALIHLARARRQVRQHAAAAGCLGRAVRLRPDRPEAWFELGNSRADLGDPVAALEAYDRALKLQPKMIEAWNNLGNTHAELGRLDEAIRCYTRALEIRSRFSVSR